MLYVCSTLQHEFKEFFVKEHVQLCYKPYVNPRHLFMNIGEQDASLIGT